MQDLLNLDDSCRLNKPGTTENNWSWRLPRNDLNIRDALKKYGDCIRLERVTPQLPLVGKASSLCCGVKSGSKHEMLSDSRFNSYQSPPYTVLSWYCTENKSFNKVKI